MLDVIIVIGEAMISYLSMCLADVTESKLAVKIASFGCSIVFRVPFELMHSNVVTKFLGKLKCRQKDFIKLVTGGPNHYEGTDMKTAHCKMSISSKDFDVTWENLDNSLKHFSVEEVLIEELKAIFYSVQEEIVKKTVAQAETSFKTKDVNQ
jgi:hypothetical protein